MKLFKAASMTDLHTQMCDWHLHASRAAFDSITSVDSQLVDVIAKADSMDWNWDVRDLWLSEQRWRNMVRQYVDPDEFQAWVGMAKRLGKRGRGQAVLRSKVVKVRGGNFKSSVTRKWGSCMLSWSYRARPEPQITMHSRTTYLGYLSALDLTVAWNMGRYIAQEVGLKTKDIQFLWFNEAVQWHNFKSMCFPLNHPDPEDREAYRLFIGGDEEAIHPEDLADIKNIPAVSGARKWVHDKLLKEDKEGISYGDMTYNTYRRVRRRYHTEVLGYDYAKTFEGWHYPAAYTQKPEPRWMGAFAPLPACPSSGLDFSVIKLPISWRLGQDMVEDTSRDMDDEDEGEEE